MSTVADLALEKLGFKVEEGQVQTLATRKNSFDRVVPFGVRPATSQEEALWALLMEWGGTCNEPTH